VKKAAVCGEVRRVRITELRYVVARITRVVSRRQHRLVSRVVSVINLISESEFVSARRDRFSEIGQSKSLELFLTISVFNSMKRLSPVAAVVAAASGNIVTTMTISNLTVSYAVASTNSSVTAASDAGAGIYEDIDAEEYMFYVVVYKWLVPALFGLIIAIGVVGNSLVVVVTLCSRRMRTTVNVLLLNLAASDLTFLLVCVPFIAYHYAADNWTIGNVACKLSQYVLYVTVYVTVYTLVAIAVVRFVRIVRSCHPRRGDGLRRTTNARFRLRMSLAAAILAAIWTTMLAANWPVLAMYHVKSYYAGDESSPAYYYCGLQHNEKSQDDMHNSTSTSWLPSAAEEWEEEQEKDEKSSDADNGPRILFLTFFLLAYVVPLTIIATMYLLIARYLHRKRRQSTLLLLSSSSTNSGPASGSGRRVGRSKTADRLSGRSSGAVAPAARGRHRASYAWRVFCSVVVAFAVCWLPLHVHLLIAYFGRLPESRSYAVYRVICHCLAYSESCVNPIVYHYVSADFRRGLADLSSAIRRRCCTTTITTASAPGSRRLLMRRDDQADHGAGDAAAAAAADNTADDAGVCGVDRHTLNVAIIGINSRY
jgi:allatostatin receptor